MDRCWLQGALGDALHALSCAAGYNIRWLLRAIARLAAKRSRLVSLKLAMPGRISINVSLVSLLDALARFVDHPSGRQNSAVQGAVPRN